MARKSKLDLFLLMDFEMKAVAAGWQVKALALDCKVSPRTLERFWKQNTNSSLRFWLNQNRLNYARALLEGNLHSIKEISAAVGYGNRSAFSSAFKLKFGCSPSQWLNRSQASAMSKPEIE